MSPLTLARPCSLKFMVINVLKLKAVCSESGHDSMIACDLDRGVKQMKAHEVFKLIPKLRIRALVNRKLPTPTVLFLCGWQSMLRFLVRTCGRGF